MLSKDNISVKDIVKSLLDNEKLLTESINNFDYEYLDSTKDKYKKVEDILNNKEDLMIVNINNVLEEIKRADEVVN